MVKNSGNQKKKDNFFTRKKFTPRLNPDKIKQKFQNDRPHSKEQIRPSTSGGQDFFVKPSNREKPTTAVNQVVTSAKQEKRPFDKKKYRLKKYSKKFKLQQWEQKREKAVLRGYYKSIKEDEPKFDVESIYKEAEEGEDDTSNANDKINEENENNLNESINKEAAGSEDESVPSSSKRKKGKAFKKAYQEFERIKGEKNKKKEEFLRKKAEKEEALKVYKKNKLEKFKKLSRKTKKGQPIMKERMELLLEKIQNSLK